METNLSKPALSGIFKEVMFRTAQIYANNWKRTGKAKWLRKWHVAMVMAGRTEEMKWVRFKEHSLCDPCKKRFCNDCMLGLQHLPFKNIG